MPPAEIDLLTIARGAVTAPAGCGKTQLIAEALVAYQGTKPILILTHTNAGVASLRGRLERAGVPAQRYRLYTIDGWSMRIISTFPARSGHNPAILRLENARADYPAIRDAAWRLLQAGHVNEVIRASYAQVIVDEYQDCSVPQHQITCWLSAVLPTCVLGDPLQAIFGFQGNALADWASAVCAHFPVVGELQTPWRWRNANAEAFGQWLLHARRELTAGRSVDVRTGPEQVTWIQLAGPEDHAQRLAAARTAAPTADGRVLIIGDSINPGSQQNVASQTPGAVTVEAVDLRDLVAFGRSFDLASVNVLRDLLAFAQTVMVNLGMPAFLQRLDSLTRGTARNPASESENLALAFGQVPTYAAAADVLQSLRQQPNVRAHRPEILRCAVKALRLAATGVDTFQAAAIRVREEHRMLGRALPRRAVGSTLLLKGLEAEVAVILNGDSLNAANLYVAMTRGSMRLVVCSVNPLLGR
jgi:DNA helicase-2/ATP-dependent DNA helicase PcrA